MPESPVAEAVCSPLKLRRFATYRGVRVLTWESDILYGCHGYEVVALQVGKGAEWDVVGRCRQVWWRNVTSRVALSSRLVRDGFHALAILDDQTNGHPAVGAVPGALVTRKPGTDEFTITHQVLRGTRPLHLTVAPSGNIYWGEYFDNRERAEVHIYGSTDGGCTWQIAYTFPAGSIRHVHNIVYDRWVDCLWILNGDEGAECKILRATRDLGSVEVILAGNQQSRAVAAIPTQNGLYFSTDTPFEGNHWYRPARVGSIEPVRNLPTSSIYACKVGEAMFFSTM